jgi:hypothetical protein
VNIADQNTEVEISAATRERIDEFSRELALVLRRITGRTPDPDFEERMPNPIPNPPSSPKENADDKR